MTNDRNRKERFLNSPLQKAAEFRRRFAMARPFPLCGHAVARRAKEFSGVAGEFLCHSRSESPVFVAGPSFSQLKALHHEIWPAIH
jgi:hypothetical protein